MTVKEARKIVNEYADNTKKESDEDLFILFTMFFKVRIKQKSRLMKMVK